MLTLNELHNWQTATAKLWYHRLQKTVTSHTTQQNALDISRK